MSRLHWLSNKTSENVVICTFFKLKAFSGFCLSVDNLFKKLFKKVISFAFCLSRARVERLFEKLFGWLLISPYGEIRKRQSMRIALGGQKGAAQQRQALRIPPRTRRRKGGSGNDRSKNR